MNSNSVYLTRENVNIIVGALSSGAKKVETTVDCNLTKTKLELLPDEVILGGRSFNFAELRELSHKLTGIIKVEEGNIRRLEFFAGKYYKLRPTRFAPTVEIDGISMHRTQDIDPWEDSRMKTAQVVKKGGIALDTCGGLGYTAIWAVRLGAKEVISVEKDENIRKLRKDNPHSRAFFCAEIQAVEGDIYRLISGFQNEIFDCVIHDPPRFSLAGELYGREFYEQLARILKPGGGMFHYTGNPYSKGRGRNFIQGITARLTEAGFLVKPCPQALGLTAVKR
ncbi:RsmD family RNA methyltransferase [bacterium]|nr:RsmD family RNA methyltransferase [FCB group bacterium]MBL7190969.1 RsmD family RNA methyltransferase [bacterium]